MAGFFGVRAASGGGQVGSTCRKGDWGWAVADSARGRPLKLRGCLLALLEFRDNVRIVFLYEQAICLSDFRPSPSSHAEISGQPRNFALRVVGPPQNLYQDSTKKMDLLSNRRLSNYYFSTSLKYMYQLYFFVKMCNCTSLLEK
jgi:hypothetical protein